MPTHRRGCILASRRTRAISARRFRNWRASSTTGSRGPIGRPGWRGPPPRHLIRPASKNADQFMIQVDLLEMASDPGARYLIRLRDITARVIDQNVVWSFQGLV